MKIHAHPIPGRVTRHDEEKLRTSIKYAPVYSGKAASALKRVIEIIHGLQKLHRTLKLVDIDIYLGKAERSTEALLRRWKEHRSEKKHMFGIVLFNCSRKDAKKFEKLAIRLVKRLKRNGKLCVGEVNVSDWSQGRNPVSDKATVYMTWCPRRKPTEYQKPTINDVREAAASVAPDFVGIINEAQIVRGLESIKRPTKFKKLHFHHY